MEYQQAVPAFLSHFVSEHMHDAPLSPGDKVMLWLAYLGSCCGARLRRVHASEGCSTDLVFNAPSAPLLRELGHSLEGDEATYMQVAVMVLAQCEMGNLVIRMDDADSVVENNVPSEFEMGNLVIRSVDSGVENNVPSEIDAANVEKNFLSVLNRNVFFNTSLDRQTSFFFSKTSAPDRLASLRDIQGRLIAGLPVPHTMFNAQFRLDDFGTLCLHNRPGQEVQDCYSAFVDGTDQQFQGNGLMEAECQIMLAFCMGTHGRLGSSLLARCISEDVLRMILVDHVAVVPSRDYFKRVLPTF